MDRTEPRQQHRWIQQLVGEWTFEGEADMGPDAPALKSTGTESVRTLDGLWVICEGQSKTSEGDQGTFIMTLGFDIKSERFVGTWIGSMMSHLFVYQGDLDPAERVLTLESEGPSWDEPMTKLSRYRDVITLQPDGARTLTSYAQIGDGSWKQFVVVNYRRRS